MTLCATCGNDLTGTSRFCPACGSPVDQPVPAGEQHSQTGTRPRRVGIVLYPLMLLVGIGLFILYINPSTHPVIRQQPVVSSPVSYSAKSVSMVSVPAREEGDDIVISLQDVVKNSLVRFEVKTRTIVRPIMAYIGTDGRLVTAISVSEHCGSTEFTIEDNHIHCARCPSHWDMMTMEAYACCAKYHPDPIASRVEGTEVRISRSVIDQWAGRM